MFFRKSLLILLGMGFDQRNGAVLYASPRAKN